VTPKMTFTITADGSSHDGWVAFLLGLPKPADDVASSGWAMAADTLLCGGIRKVLVAVSSRGQVTITERAK
jgi:hypothetical protein